MKLLVKTMAALICGSTLFFAAPIAAHAQENVPVTSDGMAVDSFQMPTILPEPEIPTPVITAAPAMSLNFTKSFTAWILITLI